MTLAAGVGASPEEAKAITSQNESLCAGRSSVYKVPSLGFKGCPLGIDIRKVVGTSTSPVINTGIANKSMGHGVCARGLLKTPITCFRSAFDAYCEKYNISASDLLATLD